MVSSSFPQCGKCGSGKVDETYGFCDAGNHGCGECELSVFTCRECGHRTQPAGCGEWSQ